MQHTPATRLYAAARNEEPVQTAPTTSTGSGNGSRLAPARQPRAQGAVRVAARLRDGRPALADLHQAGSARALFPREPAPGLLAVLLNTAGGVTGGDHFDWHAEAGPGASLTLTTQAAERIYRARPGETARIATRLAAGQRARLDWLPQETILFDGGALERTLEADLAPDATLLAVEALVLGRQAMGETVHAASFTDRWRIRRDGRPVWADTLRLVGPVAELAARPALFGPNRAAATVLLVGPDAADRLARARGLLDAEACAVEAGASARDGVLALRLLAPTGRTLRSALAPLLAGLRGAPLPRVWTI